MITVKKARQKVVAAAWKKGKIALVPVEKAAGLRLAKPVYAQVDSPSFAQSNMDGYAFAFADWVGGELQISPDVQAAGLAPKQINKGEAMRIFTGAALPLGADTVVMQEHCEAANGVLRIVKGEPKQGQHVRARASQIAKNECAMPASALLNVAAVAYLGMLGIGEVWAWAAPRISLIVTGKELVKQGQPLELGQVYECNSLSVRSFLGSLGLDLDRVVQTDDEPQEILAAINNLLPQSDILLLTGGVSVGDFDYVAAALAEAGIKKGFHRVAQKPGKPLYFGVSEGALVFGLPGNPASVLVCCYQYVLAGISGWMRRSFLRRERRELVAGYGKAAGLRHFVRARLVGERGVEILGAQDSFRMDTFAAADALAELGEAATRLEAGEIVNVVIF